MSSYSINRSATLPQFSWRNKWWACVGREEKKSGGWRGRRGRRGGEEGGGITYASREPDVVLGVLLV
jgi:hypothetical protein